MSPSGKPDREQVRQWLLHEIAQHRPPPEPGEIRRQLGWRPASADPRAGDRRRR